MALPVGPPPRSDDIAINGWSALTVRIAWTLLAAGVTVRPRVLREARAHVLLHLDERTRLPDAEDQAEMLTRQFVRRARGKNPSHPFDQDNAMPMSPRWRRVIERSMNPVTEAVFRMHYGDNRSLKYVAGRLGVDRLTVDGACAGLQEVIRRTALADGLPLDGWSPERVDRLLVRLAAWSPGPCPPLLDVVEGAHREHVKGCSRCDRTIRLVRTSVLTLEDLVPPSLGARPRDRARVLALHFHPDARKHRKGVRDELEVQATPIGDDLLLIDATDMSLVAPALVLAAELGRPHRDLVRGAVVEGQGRWSAYGVLGPLADQAEREARYRTWASIDELGELPMPVPEPPSPRRAWAVVAALGVALVISMQLAMTSVPTHVSLPLDVDFTAGRGGVWSAFDAPEDARISLVRLDPDGALEVVLQSATSADKADWAIGDGSYRTFTEGPGVLVATTRGSIPLDTLVDAAQQAPEPLAILAEAIRTAEPGADVKVHSP